jgi:hypothetical protein
MPALNCGSISLIFMTPARLGNGQGKPGNHFLTGHFEINYYGGTNEVINKNRILVSDRGRYRNACVDRLREQDHA